MDFLSNLPDELVCHILSFLTTKEAASTSLLSKRWYNLFALVPNLDIDEAVFPYSNCMSSFIDVVDRVIALQGDSRIKRFSLKCQSRHVDDPCRVDPCRVNSWISNVLQRGVSDLDLAIDIHSKYWLPPNIFHSRTLVELKVRSADYLYLERCTGREETFLPLLKTLVLKLFVISCGSKMEMFLRSFPVLEELSIGHTAWVVCDETVSSETLRKLTISSIGFGDSMLSLKSMSFDTPRLVYFDYSDYVAEDYPKVNLTNVVEALLNLSLSRVQIKQVRAPRDDQDDVLLRFRNGWKLLSGLRHVQKLYLSWRTLEVLSLCCESIPVFNNLKLLRIRSYKDQGWQAMPALLRNCPLLETLVLEGLVHYVTDKCGDACDCVPGENKGRSLISCPAKKLQIKSFQGTKRELEMVKHFLEYFRCLKVMEIYAQEDSLIHYLQIPREFELFNELYSCDVRFLVRGSIYKTWTAVNLRMNHVGKKDVGIFEKGSLLCREKLKK